MRSLELFPFPSPELPLEIKRQIQSSHHLVINPRSLNSVLSTRAIKDSRTSQRWINETNLSINESLNFGICLCESGVEILVLYHTITSSQYTARYDRLGRKRVAYEIIRDRNGGGGRRHD